MRTPDGIPTFHAKPSFLLGHQGGWDEILLVVGPLLIVGLLLWLANRRVTAQLEQAEAGDGQSPSPQGKSRSPRGK